MHVPTRGFRAPRGRPATGMRKSARPLGGRAVGRGSLVGIGTHPRDRATSGPGIGCEVVAHALLAPGRTDRRGERSGLLGRARHVERALRVRADRRDRRLARTTTRTPAWRPWSSRESRGSRGVGVHRSDREVPDWPVLPRPSPASSFRLFPMPGGAMGRSGPAGSASVPAVAELVLSRFAVLPEPRDGSGQTAPRERFDPTPSTTDLQDYCVRDSVHVAPCGPLYANSYTLGATSPKTRICGRR